MALKLNSNCLLGVLHSWAILAGHLQQNSVGGTLLEYEDIVKISM
jgi:hypothetical protein